MDIVKRFVCTIFLVSICFTSKAQDRLCTLNDTLAPAPHDTTHRISTSLEVPVFFHVIDSSVTGSQIYDFNIDDQLNDQMDILDDAFSSSKISFNHIGTNYLNFLTI